MKKNIKSRPIAYYFTHKWKPGGDIIIARCEEEAWEKWYQELLRRDVRPLYTPNVLKETGWLVETAEMPDWNRKYAKEYQ